MQSSGPVRLVGAVLIDMHDERIAADSRYLSEGSMAKPYETGDSSAPRITSKPTTPRDLSL